MTDLIERVDAVFTAEADEAQGTGPHEGSPRQGSKGRPLQILFAVTLGGSAVLLFAMASGHLKGTQATVGIVAALVQVALAIGVLSRPSRGLYAAAAVADAAVAVFWLAVEGPHAVSMVTAGIGVALSGLAVALGAALGHPARAGERVVVGDVGVRLPAPARRRGHDHRRALRDDGGTQRARRGELPR